MTDYRPHGLLLLLLGLVLVISTTGATAGVGVDGGESQQALYGLAWTRDSATWVNQLNLVRYHPASNTSDTVFEHFAEQKPGSDAPIAFLAYCHHVQQLYVWSNYKGHLVTFQLDSSNPTSGAVTLVRTVQSSTHLLRLACATTRGSTPLLIASIYAGGEPSLASGFHEIDPVSGAVVREVMRTEFTGGSSPSTYVLAPTSPAQLPTNISDAPAATWFVAPYLRERIDTFDVKNWKVSTKSVAGTFWVSDVFWSEALPVNTVVLFTVEPYAKGYVCLFDLQSSSTQVCDKQGNTQAYEHMSGSLSVFLSADVDTAHMYVVVAPGAFVRIYRVALQSQFAATVMGTARFATDTKKFLKWLTVF